MTREEVRAYQREWIKKNREKINAKARAMNKLPGRQAYAREYQLKRYQRDVDAGREKQRTIYHNRKKRDPEGLSKEIFRRSLKRYGLTLESYSEIMTLQNNSCAICQTVDPGDKRGWQIDHCHATHKVRGILCRHCNLLLGYAKDNADVLMAATGYLDNSQSDDFIGFGISKRRFAPKKNSNPSQISASAAKPQCAADLFSI